MDHSFVPNAISVSLLTYLSFILRFSLSKTEFTQKGFFAEECLNVKVNALDYDEW